MPAPNLNYSDIVATTIEYRSKSLADNVSLHNDVFKRMNQKGNVDPIDGGYKIIEELEYAENATFKWYNGFDTVDVQPQEIFSAAEYDLKLAVISVVISGTEMLQNSGQQRFINLLKRKMVNAENSFKNNLTRSLFSDGTGFNGRQLGGLQALIASNPTTGTVGNISRASWPFWQNKRFRGVTDGGAAITSTNIQSYMTQLALQLLRGSDFPDLIVFDSNYYNLYQQSLAPNFRVTTNDTTGGGFKSLKFYSVGNDSDVIFSGSGVGMPANTGYFINTNYLRLRPHTDRNMVKIGGDRQPTNQDAIVSLLGWAGNMTCSNMALQGTLIA
jgi:hypothetical protein